MSLTSHEISAKYDRFARYYDWVEGVVDLLGLRVLRRRWFSRASGSVLEVAVGTGKNLSYYPPGCGITAIDRSPAMLELARKKAARVSMPVSFALADAETLPFASGSFDTVASSLSLCTFPNPAFALREMARVCRAGGKIFLLEHGRSDRERLARWQDRRTERHARQLGCHWNRDPVKLVRDAGLKIGGARRSFFGIFQEIEAAPAANSTMGRAHEL